MPGLCVGAHQFVDAVADGVKGNLLRAAKVAGEVASQGENHTFVKIVADVRDEIFDGELAVEDFA